MMTSSTLPVLERSPTILEPRFVEKPWGRQNGILPYLGNEPLGEIIFNATDTQLIVKWLQTSECLSVQVHPKRPAQDFKDEWWYVADTLDDAYLYLGFREEVTSDQVSHAAKDGTLLDMLNRIEPKKGDSFFIPGGTIHALGPGLTIVEVQEPSETTYRLYDYGRPRELHLEQAMSSLILHPTDIDAYPTTDADFQVEYYQVAAGETLSLEDAQRCISIMSGTGKLQDMVYEPYQCIEYCGKCLLVAEQDSEYIISSRR